MILKGGIYISDQGYSNDEDVLMSASNPFDLLSNKEMDILAYLLQGKTTKEMSNLLSLQVSTVSTHKFRIFQKLNVNNLVELMELGKEYQLI